MSGFFVVNESDQVVRDEERKREEEAQEIADETMELVASAGNDLFPDFLWEPQLNEFENDDAYRLKASCQNPAVLRAYTIAKKYQKYWDYVDAMEAYIEYAKYIETVYGDFDMMARASKEGYSTVYIPALPKLTHKKKNKIILESGFMPSRTDDEFIPPDGSVEESLSMLPTGELEESEKRELPKRVKRIQESMVQAKKKMDRINGIYTINTGGSHQGMDAIINFLTNSNSDNIQNRGQGNLSIAESIEDLHIYDHIPEEIANWMALPQSTAIIVDSVYMDKSKVEAKELIRELEKNGYDFLFSSATSSMDKEAVRALHREFKDIDLDRLPKKERKKYKKMLKKEKQRKMEIIGSDRRLQQTLLNNRIRLNQTDMYGGINPDFINFHLSDAFPMGDK